MIFVPEDSGSGCNSSDTPSKGNMVSGAHGEALMDPAAEMWHFDAKVKREARPGNYKIVAPPLINSHHK